MMPIMHDLNGKQTTYETRDGHRYTKYEDDKYRMYEKTNEDEKNIDVGHYYGYFKDDTGLYNSYWTNHDSFITFTSKEPEKPKEKQYTIFEMGVEK